MIMACGVTSFATSTNNVVDYLSVEEQTEKMLFFINDINPNQTLLL